MYEKYCGVPKQEIDACPTVGWIRDFADPLSCSTCRSTARRSRRPTTPTGAGQRSADQRRDGAAAARRRPDARAQAWANVDKMLVDQAVAAPEKFDNQPNIESANVAGVNAIWNTGFWDLDFTSLK